MAHPIYIKINRSTHLKARNACRRNGEQILGFQNGGMGVVKKSQLL